MGRKKGSKNRMHTESQSVPVTQVETTIVSEGRNDLQPAEVSSGQEISSLGPSPVQPASDLGDNNRDAIYEEYRKSQETESTDNTVADSEPFPDVKGGLEGTTEEVTTETSPEEEVTAAEYKAADGEKEDVGEGENEDKVDKKEHDEKLVPYDALHAEREKRKDIQSKLDEVLQSFKKLEESKSLGKTDDDLGYEDEYSVRIKKLEDENNQLKEVIGNVEQRFIKEDQTQFNRKIETDVVSVDKALSEQGFPGFKDFGQNLVVQHLNNIAAEKGEEEAQIYRNPKGWEMIWKELFPKVNSVFSGKNKEEGFNNKRNLKKSANLVGSPGQAPKEEKKTDEWTYDDYLKSRAASAA